MYSDLPQIVNRFQEAKRFCLVGHLSPDGDSLGSILSLALSLKQLNKQVFPLCFDGIPDKYLFLPGIELFKNVLPKDEKVDILVFLDCSDPARIGEVADTLMAQASLVVNIDHHADNKLFGDLNFHNEKAPATGEIVYALLQELGIEIDLPIATNLYTSIVTDTGSFAYANTSASTHHMAAFLIEKGVNPAEVSEYAFQMKPYCELKLIGKALDHLQISEDGTYAWVVLPLKWFLETDCPLDATEGVVNYARYIPGVQVGLAFKEVDENSVKVSLRSSHQVDVSKIAAAFGGGGHRQAAGCTLNMDLISAQEAVLEMLKNTLANG